MSAPFDIGRLIAAGGIRRAPKKRRRPWRHWLDCFLKISAFIGLLILLALIQKGH